ncbi:MAG: ATP-binding protein [Chloroflexi bacterium]|nr:ATP-binding protein [Chloroflexota bacterium]
MHFFYPPDQQALFTNRERELAELAHYRQRLQAGSVEHIALFGLRRIGKTLLLKESLRQTLADGLAIAPVYMDFSYLCSSPENFALGYIGQICYWLLARGESDPEPFLSANTLPSAVLQAGASDLHTALQPILRELEKARPDRQALLRQAFRFPRELVNVRKRHLILIFDEFQEIRALANFPNSRNVIALFRAEIQSQSGILYVLAGSAVSVLTDLLSDPKSPLFAQFTRLPVGPFTRDETGKLARKLTSDLVGPDLWPVIYSLTDGHPFYVTALCQRLLNLVEVMNKPVDVDTVKQAFVAETLAPIGRIYDFCRYVYDLSLQKAVGYGSLKAVLQMLATEEGLTASQVARRLRVTAASASDYLRWLREVDLISERERRYYFRDPVLRFWVANVVRGVEVSLTAESLDLTGLIARLDVQFQRASEELGVTQESRIREIMRRFAGQTVDGSLLGRSEPMVLPTFIKVDEYLSPDGQMQLDAVAETADAHKWAVEVKWRNKRVGMKELERLYKYARALSAQAWLVSKAGFPEDALTYARRHRMSVSDAEAVEGLEALLKA